MYKQLTCSLMIVCMIGIAIADPVPVRDCGTKGVTLNSFDISGCSKFPCVFPKNQNASLTISITSNTSYTSLSNIAYGVIAGIKVPFPLPQPDVCSNGVTCPINQGTTFTETILVPVLGIYPSVINLNV